MHKAIKQKKHSMQIHLRAKINEQMDSTESKSHNGENCAHQLVPNQSVFHQHLQSS